MRPEANHANFLTANAGNCSRSGKTTIHTWESETVPCCSSCCIPPSAIPSWSGFDGKISTGMRKRFCSAATTKVKEYSVPILDASPNTINALRRLQLTQKSVFPDHSIPFRFMFPALSTGKYARFTPGKDVRTSIQTVRNIVKQSAEKAGLGKLSCLDLRYTRQIMFSKSDISHADIALSEDG